MERKERASPKKTSTPSSSKKSSKERKRRIRELEDDIEGKKIRLRKLIDNAKRLEDEVISERQNCRAAERELGSLKHKLKETKSQLQKANDLVSQKDQRIKLLESQQNECDDLLKRSAEHIKWNQEEINQLENRVLDHATMIVNQKDDLKKAAEKISEQDKAIKKYEVEVEERRKEQIWMVSIISKREEEVNRLTGECDQFLKFVQGIQNCSQFSQNDTDSIVNQLDRLTEHVQKRMTMIPEFNSSVPSQIQPIILPSYVSSSTPPFLHSHSEVTTDCSSCSSHVCQDSIQILPSSSPSTSKQTTTKNKNDVLRRSSKFITKKRKPFKNLKSYLRKLHAKTNRQGLTISNFISGRSAYDMMLKSGEENLCSGAIKKNFTGSPDISIPEILKPKQLSAPMKLVEREDKRYGRLESPSQELLNGQDICKSTTSSLTSPCNPIMSENFLNLTISTIRREHKIDPAKENACMCGIPFYNSQGLTRHITLRSGRSN